MMLTLRSSACWTSITLLSLAAPLVAAPLQYNRDIRPILSDKCFSCHGFDAKHRKGELRLDEQPAAFGKGESGKIAIVPGKPDESEVMKRILTTDEDDLMPPKETHKFLTEAERKLIRQWIEEGASYQKHWAFEPVTAPPGTGNGIDHFLNAEIAKHGLTVSKPADKSVLLRRVSMALTGLPPSTEEQAAFLSDTAPDAYERMVDRYLGSLHYGEEMARHWLDVARYADTHGLHLDNERQMYAYRDWVIQAFNTNQPFDQFTIEQLAGDLLPNPSLNQLVATGFNRCNVTTSEGGSIDAEFVFRYAVERASTTAQTWLGLTAGCAVCHDHKYDPVTARDFYSLYAFFHSSADPAMDGNALLTKPVVKVKTTEYDTRIAEFDKRRAEIQTKMDAAAASITYQDPADQQPPPPVTTSEQIWFEDAFPVGAQVGVAGHPLTLVEAPEPVHSGKRSLKRSGPEMAQDYYNAGAAPFTVPQDAKFFVHVYLDPKNPPQTVMIQFHSSGWKHRAVWGKDIIPFGTVGTTERYVAGPLPKLGEWVKLEVDGTKMGLTHGTSIAGYAFTVHGGTVYFDTFGVQGRSDPSTDPLLSFKAWRKDSTGKDVAGATGDVKKWLKEGPDKPRKPEETKRLQDFYVQTVCTSTREKFLPLTAEMDVVQKEREAFDAAVPSTFIWKDMEKPRDSFIMLRGQYDKPGDKVEPATPAVLPALKKTSPDARANRLDLANWLVSRENPLTSRVTVNRFWQQFYGVGLVKSSHDFGTQGDLPSHPELLDWLSTWFQDAKWDVKKLVRLMVTSEAFRRDSAAPAADWEKDRENRYLARGPRFRLDAEQLRDQALFLGGLLNKEMGGKGVKPYQPANIWEPVGFAGSNTRFYTQDKGAALYRRSIYTFLKRTAPAPFMINFDAPSREQSCMRRERSNTPLQALQLLNDVQHVEAARGLATRLMKEPGGTPERVTAAFKIVLSRAPAADELPLVVGYFDQQLKKYQSAPAGAGKAVRFGDTPPPAGVNEAELAAWSLVANLILNMDETIVRN